MKKGTKRLTWEGSRRAQREHERALRQHPPVSKSTPRRRKNGKKDRRSPERIRPDRSLRFLPYADYLLTPWWHQRRQQILKQRGYRCERCPAREQLVVHHQSYDRLGAERDSDLEVLCRACHEHDHANWIQAQQHLRDI